MAPRARPRPSSRTFVVVAAAFALAAAGCGDDGGGSPSTAGPTSTAATTVAPTAGTTVTPLATTTTAAPAGSRPFAPFVPTGSAASDDMPLVVLLHGYGMSGDAIEAVFGFRDLASRLGFVYVHPDGTFDAGGNRFWNATDGCCNPGDLPVDDSAYLAGMIETILDADPVDDRRIYLIGTSNGGFMSYRMACDHADRIAAIVSISGATWLDPTRCTPSEPVSVLEIHGTADDLILYEGGTFVDEPYPSAEATVATWAAYNGCEPEPRSAGTSLDLDASLDGAETVVSRFDGCAGGSAVELWTVTGGGHVFDFTPAALETILEFLFAHAKP